MQKSRRTFLSVSALTSLGALLPVSQALAQLKSGRDYIELPQPQPPENPGKIEVIEFFSYGCGHCKDFHPVVKAWSAKLPADVSFRRVPVVWNAAWGNLARLFFTLEALGELNRLDDAVFVAIHDQRKRIFDQGSMTEWYVSQGGDAKKFTEAFSSFGVLGKMKHAEQLGKAMRIESVPSVVVEGKYLVQGSTFEAVLANTDALIARARKK